MTKRPRRKAGDFDHPAMTYKAPKGLRRFRAGMALIVTTLVITGVWTGGWFIAQAVATSAMTDWMDKQNANGATVSYASLDLSGYPTRIIMKITAPHYSGPVLGENIDWSGDSLTISTRPWNPTTLHIEAPGRHDVKITAKGLAFQADVKKLTVDLTPGADWPQNLKIAVKDLNLRDLTSDTRASVGNLDLSLNADTRGAELRLSVKGEALHLPKTVKLPLGNLMQSVDIEIKVDRPLSPTQLRGNLSDVLPAWQRRENKIDLQRFKMHYGPLGITTSGLLNLDEGLQPTGVFTAKIEGLFHVLEILRIQGLVRPANAVIATMALSIFSKRPSGGGPSSINLSVKLKNGKLNLGPVSILDMGHFTWGIPAPVPIIENVPTPRNYKNVPPIF